MTGAIAIIATAAVIIGVAWAIVIVTIGIRREERAFARTGLVSLTRQAPGQASHAGRLATGLYVRRRCDVLAADPRISQDLLV